MADDQLELRRINWAEVFGFTHIFKGFRMAIHPSKLLLAVAALILIYLVGWVMDVVWRWTDCYNQPSDVFLYYQVADYDDVRERRERQNADALVNDYLQLLSTAGPLATQGGGNESVWANYNRAGGRTDSEFGQSFNAMLAARRERLSTDWRTQLEALGANDQARREKLQQQARGDLDDVWDQYEDHVEIALDRVTDGDDAAINAAQAEAGKRIDESGRTDPSKSAAREQLAKDVAAAKRAVWMTRNALLVDPGRQYFGNGPFTALANYEGFCFDRAIASVRRLSFFGGWDTLLAAKAQPPTAAMQMADPVAFPNQQPESVGAFVWIFLMLWGLLWLVGTHPVFALIFLLIALAIWAVLGGAIARIAALHFAREEKISMGQAIRFSIGKFFSYFTAPLIPLAIILVLGVLLGLGGLLMTLPVADIIMGIIFFVALIVGAVIAFLAIGLGAGLPLMYPTIAVEGSDSFDAISRSFSYVFARPWRYLLYTLVALVYGTVCYLFVRFFAFLVLLATHFFVSQGFFGLGASTNAAPELAPGAGKLDLLWRAPTYMDLAGGLNWSAMGPLTTIASIAVNVWVYLVVLAVTAFVVSFVVSAHTVIYYLLRRRVDATDLDDVYVEEPEEEPVAPESPTAGAGTTPAGEAQATEPAVGTPGPEQPAEPPRTDENPPA